jgi:hypothetical protein
MGEDFRTEPVSSAAASAVNSSSFRGGRFVGLLMKHKGRYVTPPYKPEPIHDPAYELFF